MFEVLQDIAQKNVWGKLLGLIPLFDCTTDPFLTVFIYVGVFERYFLNLYYYLEIVQSIIQIFIISFLTEINQIIDWFEK
jgi:hypothetical protein